MRGFTGFSLIVISILIVLNGCQKEEKEIVRQSLENQPVIVNVQNAYTFTVFGDEFSTTRSDPVSFLDDSVSISLTVAAYSGGSGRIRVLATDSTELFQESTDGNKTVVVMRKFPRPPGNITLQLNSFSGQLSFVVAQVKPKN